jgi:hypothetical protein
MIFKNEHLVLFFAPTAVERASRRVDVEKDAEPKVPDSACFHRGTFARSARNRPNAFDE